MDADFRRKVTVYLSCLLLILSATYAFGQGVVTGSVSGTVVDPQGAVIVGAKVTARNTATNQENSDSTGANGAFSIRSVPPGTYELTVEAPNFQKLTVKNVAVKVGVDAAMGALKLTVGATSETVTVEATVPLVETTTSQLSSTFQNKEATDLPIGTNFDRLALLVPGAANTGSAGFSNNNGTGISMNGQRGRSNNFQIDGQSNNDNSVAGPSLFLGNQDIIAEVQVISNNFSAEYGRNMGSVINYTTKAGTNSFHGTAFEFYTGNFTFSHENQEKNPLFGFCPALDPSATSCTIPAVPRFTEHRLGGTIGGPIMKDKLWFFGSVMRDGTGSNFVDTCSGGTSCVTPTPAGLVMLENFYCGAAVTTFTPVPCPSHPGLGAFLNNGPFANPDGNPTQTGTIVLRTMNDAGCVPGPCNGALANVPFAGVKRNILSNSTDWEASGRVDFQISPKDRFFARYLFQNLLFLGGTGQFAAGSWVDEPGRTQQIGVDWVHNLTDHFINQARFSYSRAKFSFEGEQGAPPGWGNCLVASIFNCKTGITFQTIDLNVGYQTNLPQDRMVNNSQWQDNLSWVHGRHTLKFGGEYARQRSPNNFLPAILGSTAYGCFSSSACTTSLMSNLPIQISLTQGPLKFNFKEQDVALYVQDDVRLRDNFTFQLGLRWEFNQQAINLLHDLTTTRESNPATAFWNIGLPLNQRTVGRVPQDLNNFGPVIGFAYTPRIWESVFGRDKTVIRGGFRIAYDPSFYNIFLNVATGAPTVNSAALTTALCGTACNSMPAGTNYTGGEMNAARLPFMPLGTDPGLKNQTNVAPDFHNPYAEQWNFGVQRELTSKLALEVRYVGDHTIGNFQTFNSNPFLGNPAAAPGTGSLARDFPGFIPAGIECLTPGTVGQFHIDCNRRNVRTRGNTAWSIYHGLQTELRIRGFHGVTGGVEWTWSRAIDNVSEIFTSAAGNVSAAAQNFFNIDQPERGVSGYSYPHVATVWWIYEFPWYKSQQGFVGKLLGGWQMNGIWSYRSGQALNPRNNTINGYCDTSWNTNFIGSTTDSCRPILFNASAPLDSVGVFSSPATGCTLSDFNGTGLTTFHWIRDSVNASLCMQNPFAGAGRNIVRGDTNNNVDFSVYKNFKVTERSQLQLQFNGFNVLNRQFRGSSLGTRVESGSFVQPTPFSHGSFMNNYFNASGRRSMTFGIKFIF